MIDWVRIKVKRNGWVRVLPTRNVREQEKRTPSTKFIDWGGAGSLYSYISLLSTFICSPLPLSPVSSLRLLSGRGERGLNLSLLVCKAALLYRLPLLTTPRGTGLK